MRLRLLEALGPLLGLVLLSVAVVVLHHELQAFHLHDVLGHLRDIPPGALGLAVVLTALGYLTLTGYDALAFLSIGNPLPYRRVALVSFVAFVFSHNVGLSFFGGSAVRYRMLSSFGVRPDEIARVIVFALLTFWLGFFLLGGIFLTAWPLAVDLPGIHLASSRPIGIVLLVVLAAYLVLVARRRAPLLVHGFRVDLPRPATTGAQLVVSAADWLLAASVLHAVLPAAPGFGFPTFLGAYLLALFIGLVSHVPAGLGVFEGAMVLLLRPYLPGDQVLAAILAYRLVYYLLPMLLAVALFGGYEAQQGRAGLRRTAETLRGFLSPVAPRLLSVAIFLAGALLLFSGATPALPHRLAWLRSELPLPLVELSTLLGSVVGVLLLLLANALRQRVDAAYYATLALLGAGALACLLKGLDWEEAAILLAMALALLPCHGFFYRRSSLLAQPLSRGWGLAMAVVGLGLLLTLGLAYRHVEYTHELWWQFGFQAQAPRSLRAALAAGVTLLALGAARLLRPAPPLPAPPDREQLDRAQAIVARSGQVNGYLALLGDKQLLFHADGGAFVMFGVSGRTWVAMGDPIGPREQREALAWQLRELADRHGAQVVFYEVSDQDLPIYLELGLDLRKLGEAGRVPLEGFSLEGRRRADLRQARNRLAREGCRFEMLPASGVPAVLDPLREVSDDWLRAKHTREKRFSLGSFTPEYLCRLPVALVRRGDDILGFANVWPSETREECSIDLMRYRGDAPKGLMDYLFAELMLWASHEGYAWFSLGMAPLAGFERHRLAPVWNRVGALLFRHGEHFYNFRGLREFKQKFDPVWEPRYLAGPGGLTTPLVLTRIARLVSGGLTGVVSR